MQQLGASHADATAAWAASGGDLAPGHVTDFFGCLGLSRGALEFFKGSLCRFTGNPFLAQLFMREMFWACMGLVDRGKNGRLQLYVASEQHMWTRRLKLEVIWRTRADTRLRCLDPTLPSMQNFGSDP